MKIVPTTDFLFSTAKYSETLDSYLTSTFFFNLKIRKSGAIPILQKGQVLSHDNEVNPNEAT
jgi:hypothetical protein